jgi:hypothetical protein
MNSEGHVRFLAPFGVLALREWLDDAKITQGYLFRRVLPTGAVGERPLTDHEVARIFKRLAHRVDAGGRGVAGIAGLPSEIEKLPDLGYLKFASQPEWRRVTLKP